MKDLLEKELTRKEFLLHLGFGLLFLSGVQGLLKGLLELGNGNKKQIAKMSYGSSGYGG